MVVLSFLTRPRLAKGESHQNLHHHLFIFIQELERAWREYDKLEYDVTVTKNHMQEQLERLGEVQVWPEHLFEISPLLKSQL